MLGRWMSPGSIGPGLIAHRPCTGGTLVGPWLPGTPQPPVSWAAAPLPSAAINPAACRTLAPTLLGSAWCTAARPGSSGTARTRPLAGPPHYRDIPMVLERPGGQQGQSWAQDPTLVVPVVRSRAMRGVLDVVTARCPRALDSPQHSQALCLAPAASSFWRIRGSSITQGTKKCH